MSSSSSFATPASVTAIATTQPGLLLVGLENATLQVYDLEDYALRTTIDGFEDEISSIVGCTKGKETKFWLAAGRKVHRIQLDLSNGKIERTVSSDLCDAEDSDDILNEIALDESERNLAFSSDSGQVGVLDIAAMSFKRMKSRHQNVCGCVKFIPDRPRELVSGGFDQKLIHYDWIQGSILSTVEIASAPLADLLGGASLSPPFVMSTAMASSGLFAAGTADGRLFVGLGGEKSLDKTKRKKARKWLGLGDPDFVFKVAEGPIVAMSEEFSTPKTLVTSTLLGTLMSFDLNDPKWSPTKASSWLQPVKEIGKVNALVTLDSRVIVGGIAKDGKGRVEMWDLPG